MVETKLCLAAVVNLIGGTIFESGWLAAVVCVNFRVTYTLIVIMAAVVSLAGSCCIIDESWEQTSCP